MQHHLLLHLPEPVPQHHTHLPIILMEEPTKPLQLLVVTQFRYRFQLYLQGHLFIILLE